MDIEKSGFKKPTSLRYFSEPIFSLGGMTEVKSTYHTTELKPAHPNYCLYDGPYTYMLQMPSVYTQYGTRKSEDKQVKYPKEVQDSIAAKEKDPAITCITNQFTDESAAAYPGASTGFPTPHTREGSAEWDHHYQDDNASHNPVTQV